ncbi:hypothetical protein [Desulfitobacterium sp.]|uniref:hypothetical protein n=1 Tax=Desulfitobacterium sp. TaxID=49981 RepID=UPI002CA29964|nr:hypothetical protein [Desulfitobacterium sp.]HVJ49397.1 hypothetical protein [Desulfitobacterium sp.]
MNKRIISQVKPIQSNSEKQTYCVNCCSREIRKIARDRYYCPDCCTEFVTFGNKVIMYSITEDGSLKKIG